MNRVSAPVSPPSQTTACRLTASKYSSNLARSWPPSASPNSLNYGLQVHLWVHSISVSKCVSTFARSRRPSASLSSLDRSLQVHLQRCSITASKYISTERPRVYGDTGVTEVDRVTGSIYSADPRVDWHHLISISSYHTTKIHTLSFPTFRLTRSIWDFVDPPNCVDPQRQVVSYLLTRFLRCWSQAPLFLMNSVWMSQEVPCWWWALCLLAPSFHHNGLQVVHL